MSLSKIARTAQIDLAWRQGDTAAAFEVGLTRPKNPYHPDFAPLSHEAWRRGFQGHPLDARGGFVEAQAEEASA